MLKTLQNAWKIKEIRQKLFFTFLMLIVIRIGSQIPVPGVNREYFQAWFAGQTSDVFSFFDVFTGGSFTQMSIFALNISPYITASIIVQLLTIAIPKLEEMHKDEDGRKKINQITRYATVGLALVEGAPPAEKGVIDAPIGRAPGSIIQRCVCAGGKPSLTEYEVVRRCGAHTLVRARTVTGRTHQLRVHFAHIGCPLAGDDLYGGSRARIARHALHCACIRFTEPVSGDIVETESPLPADMAALAKCDGDLKIL